MRRLGVRYVAVFAAVAALIAADQAVIQPLLVRMNVYAPTINTAGRQRMLSQKLAKAALALDAVRDGAARSARRAELREALEQWSTAHRALRGDDASELPVIRAPQIEVAWGELEPHFRAMQAAARRLVEHPPELMAAAEAPDSLQEIVDHEAAFLVTMDQIVKIMEEQATEELRQLRASALAIAIAIVLLFLGLGWFVVRPATRAIRGQVDELEARVVARTRALDDTLASLRQQIYERQEVESRNLALGSQLAHADRVESLGHLAAGLAHELNQPLGAIANYAEACGVVLSSELDASHRGRLHEYAQEIQRASLRAGQIVRRIRNFVRPGLGVRSVVGLTAVMQEVIDLCRPEAIRADVDLIWEAPAADALVAIDPIQIQQVLVNLVQNALQAMERTPPAERRLVVRMAGVDNAVQIDVVDRGPGLDDSDPDSLFVPFRTTKSTGLGVGLSICRSIVELHQGTIWAKSLPGGAQFSFVLPLATRHATLPSQQPDCLCR